jgi:uncharacterized protein YqeY
VSLLLQLQEETKTALKAGRKVEVSALRLLVDELQKAAKAKGAKLTSDEEIKVLRREHKRRLESAEAFAAGQRQELEQRERYEAELIERLLPNQLDEAALRLLVDQVVTDSGATTLRDMGKVMSEVMQRG